MHEIGARVRWYVYGHKFTGRVEERFNAHSYIVRRDKLNDGQSRIERDLVDGRRCRRA